MTELLDYHTDLIVSGGDMGIMRVQHIPDDFMASLADSRLASSGRARDVHRVASVPASVVDRWAREGFDIYRESAKAIVKRLRAESLDHFLATRKNI